MKPILLNHKKIVALFIFMLALNFVAMSTTYTAIVSGNWSSSTTWGVSSPSFTITTDQVVIPSGITVTMDNNVTVNGFLAQLTVDGILSSGSSTSLTATTGSVNGAGTINVGSAVFGTGAILVFTGNFIAGNITSSTASLQTAAKITVNQTLALSAGVLSLQSNGSLTIGNNALITISGGQLLNNGGSLSLTTGYSVVYTSGTFITGLEVSGTGLKDVTIDVNAGNTVTLSGDLTVNGTLALTSGTLSLGLKNLNIKGDVASSGNGKISSTSLSNITVNSAASLNGALNFASGNNTVNNFSVKIGGGGSVRVASDLNVTGTLDFISGRLDIGSHKLTIGPSGTITGAGTTTYISLSDSGKVSISLTAGLASTLFPIGTSTSYHPAHITLNTGSGNGRIDVGVNNNVYSSGTTGLNLSATQHLVDATWHVSADFTSNMNMTLKLAWPTTAEVNGFVRTSAYISHYTNGHWDTNTMANATVEGAGMYSVTRTNITSLSPFTVFDQSTGNGIDFYKATELITTYPNPSNGTIYIQNFDDNKIPIHVTILNMNGQEIVSLILENDKRDVNVGNLKSGCYYMRIQSEKINVIRKFIQN